MKTPESILEKFEAASENLNYGDVILKFSVKQGKRRFVISKEESFLPDDLFNPKSKEVNYGEQ